MAKIFISYTQHDVGTARDVFDTLTRAGLKPWLDKVEIMPGDSFLERMNEGLREASYVLLLLSKASLTSRWVTREWMSAMASGRTVVVPILIDDVEPPPLLRDIVYIDFRDKPSGTEQLLSFFQRELKPLGATEPVLHSRVDVSRDVIRTLTPREIRLIAVACMTDSALSAFLIDADLDPGEIQGTSLNERILSLLHRVQREGVVISFLEWLTLEQARCFTRNLMKVRAQPQWVLNPDETQG